MRALDRYLRLDDMALTIISEDENGRPFSTDASGMIGASTSVQDSMGFVESRIGSVGMFTMHGTWQDMLDVLLIHVSGKGRIVVVTPGGAKPVMRRSLARDIRRAVRLAEGYMF
jgi:hypothetical protein